MEQNGTDSFEGERGGIITARGTNDGLIIRLDGRVDQRSLRDALNDFMISRKGFLAGNEVAFEWIGYQPAQEFVAELSEVLHKEFDVTVKDSRFRENQKSVAEIDVDGIPGADASSIAQLDSSSGRSGGFRKKRGSEGDPLAASRRGLSLFDGLDAVSGNMAVKPHESEVDFALAQDDRAKPGVNPILWDDPDARVVYATLRSGQKIETDHSLVIFGNVNSGAEVIAGGDIVVLGELRGVAHAGAYDESGGGRVIFALNLQPTQLRIGSVISRGSSEGQRAPEVARVEGTMIVVETYNSKTFCSVKR